MKKLVSLLLTVLFSCHVAAQSVQHVVLDFSQKNFTFSHNENGSLVIGSRTYICGYGSDVKKPGLPVIPVNVRIQNNAYGSFSYTGEPSKIFENVVVAANPAGVPTNTVAPKSTDQVPYCETTFPSSNVQFVEESKFDGYSVLRFLVCPFVYDTKEKSLSLISDMSLNINLKATASYSAEDTEGGENMSELVNSIVVNPQNTDANLFPTFPGADTLISAKKSCKYLIITSSDLADSFKPLASWKTQKGLWAKIATIDEIVAEYPAKDTQLSIKSYLYNMYKSDGLKYVLLGGDDSVVPVRGCYGKAGIYNSAREDYKIPTDLYYSCFDGDFSWDANGNGIYGEESDYISMNPSIFVTRAPVRSNEDVNTFVNKIVGYEKNPTENGWKNRILMAGDELSESDATTGLSDAQIKGDELYNQYISRNWNGSRTRLYDTYPDVNGKYLSVTNFQEEIQKGYAFVDVISHGNSECWQFGNERYSLNEAKTIENSNYTIITTIACSTNAFDSFEGEGGRYFYDPCLSESFIRNPKSGVVAYLGCSREGWYSNEELYSLTNSLQYEALFYDNLFGNSIKDKNFGQIVATAKQQMASLCTKYGENRWIQFGLNPVGDPEMPIYTSSPSSFDGKCTWKTDINGTYLDTGVDGCTVCVMSFGDDGKSYYMVNNGVRTVRIPKKTVSVCVTKQGYIPWCKSRYLDYNNEIASCSVNRADGNVAVATNVYGDAKKSMLVLSSINGERLLSADVPTGAHTTNIEMSKMKDGVSLVSLYVDGKLVDSKNIIK